MFIISMGDDKLWLYVLGAGLVLFMLAGATCVETMVSGPTVARPKAPRKGVVLKYPPKRKAPSGRALPKRPMLQVPRPRAPSQVSGAAYNPQVHGASYHPSPLLSPSVHGPTDMKGIHGPGQKKKPHPLGPVPVRR